MKEPQHEHALGDLFWGCVLGGKELPLPVVVQRVVQDDAGFAITCESDDLPLIRILPGHQPSFDGRDPLSELPINARCASLGSPYSPRYEPDADEKDGSDDL